MGTVEPGRNAGRSTQDRIASAFQFHLTAVTELTQNKNPANIELALQHLNECKRTLETLLILEHYTK